MYICMHLYACIYIYLSMYKSTYEWICVNVRRCTSMLTCINMQVYEIVFMNICIYICIYVYVYICICLYTYAVSM